ncbi:MAG: hypothetical protein ACRDRT_06465, partial [Pseudonocardiaceae bacterium]
MKSDRMVSDNSLAFTSQRVQRLRRLTRNATARATEKAFVLEGATLLSEALDSGAPVESVYLAAGADLAVA